MEGPLRSAMETVGLRVSWLSGFSNAASRFDSVRLDAVLVLTRRVSHAVADHAVRIGESSGAVVLHVHTLGQSTVLEAAREALA